MRCGDLDCYTYIYDYLPVIVVQGFVLMLQLLKVGNSFKNYIFTLHILHLISEINYGTQPQPNLIGIDSICSPKLGLFKYTVSFIIYLFVLKIFLP